MPTHCRLAARCRPPGPRLTLPPSGRWLRPRSNSASIPSGFQTTSSCRNTSAPPTRTRSMANSPRFPNPGISRAAGNARLSRRQSATCATGVAVLILPYRHPLLTAKMIATLDNLSGGRVDLGIGVGWMREEFEALGQPAEGRHRAPRAAPRMNSSKSSNPCGHRTSPRTRAASTTSKRCVPTRRRAAPSDLGGRTHARGATSHGAVRRRVATHRWPSAC